MEKRAGFYTFTSRYYCYIFSSSTTTTITIETLSHSILTFYFKSALYFIVGTHLPRIYVLRTHQRYSVSPTTTPFQCIIPEQPPPKLSTSSISCYYISLCTVYTYLHKHPTGYVYSHTITPVSKCSPLLARMAVALPRC